MFKIISMSGVYFPPYHFAVNRFLNSMEDWSEPHDPVCGQRRIRGPDNTHITVFLDGKLLIGGTTSVEGFSSIMRLVDSFPAQPTFSTRTGDWRIDQVNVFVDLDADILGRTPVRLLVENVKCANSVPDGLVFCLGTQNKTCTTEQLDEEIQTAVSKLEELT
jgi:hypothetical protein